MSRLLRNFAIGAVLVAGIFCTRPAAAQAPGKVRVVHGPVRIQGWYRTPDPEILFEAREGTILEVLARENDWYWVITPPDAHGTRRAGWIRAGHVEAVAPVISGSAPDQQESREGTSPAPVSTIADAADTVVITDRPDPAASSRTAAAKAYTFEDVHFGRNQSALRPEDMEPLRTAVTALKADPTLEVNIHGHTCSLGTAAYNLELGLRRAAAVKDYLVGEGIAAERLHMISLGEGDAKYENSAEQTRHLNRRVALLPQ